ncbi:hypothetical protein LZ31DRAFT_143526 [Colletotrichum somersetense]|nr:hypothetical protein LZ31DRAFT_143526 [Colletotrichum somersetense]
MQTRQDVETPRPEIRARLDSFVRAGPHRRGPSRVREKASWVVCSLQSAGRARCLTSHSRHPGFAMLNGGIHDVLLVRHEGRCRWLPGKNSTVRGNYVPRCRSSSFLDHIRMRVGRALQPVAVRFRLQKGGMRVSLEKRRLGWMRLTLSRSCLG